MSDIPLLPRRESEACPPFKMIAPGGGMPTRTMGARERPLAPGMMVDLSTVSEPLLV